MQRPVALILITLLFQKSIKNVGRPLLPYAAKNYANEIYTDIFARTHDFMTIGLRYFNIFGRCQDPDGVYTAFIPKWTAPLPKGEPVFINGDGETNGDFCSVTNAMEANLISAATDRAEPQHQIYNIGARQRTTLNQPFEVICTEITQAGFECDTHSIHRDTRTGDVSRSHDNTETALRFLGYSPTHTLMHRLAETGPWYVAERCGM